MLFHSNLASIQIGLPKEVEKTIWDHVLGFFEAYGWWGRIAAVLVCGVGLLTWIYLKTRVQKRAEADAVPEKPLEPAEPKLPAIEPPPREIPEEQAPEASEGLKPDLVHPYRLQPNFTGRVAERQWLTEWFTADSRPVCVVEAIGGMGKSALAWFWLHADVLGTPPAGYSKEDPENLRVPEDQRPEGRAFLVVL